MTQYLIVTYRENGVFVRGGHCYSETNSDFAVVEEDTRKLAVEALANFYFIEGTEVYSRETPYGDRQTHLHVNGYGVDSYEAENEAEVEASRSNIAEAKAIVDEARARADEMLAEKKAKDTQEAVHQKAREATEERARDLRQLEALKQKLGTG